MRENTVTMPQAVEMVLSLKAFMEVGRNEEKRALHALLTTYIRSESEHLEPNYEVKLSRDVDANARLSKRDLKNSRKFKKAADALREHDGDYQAASKSLGVSVRTLYRWQELGDTLRQI